MALYSLIVLMCCWRICSHIHCLCCDCRLATFNLIHSKTPFYNHLSKSPQDISDDTNTFSTAIWYDTIEVFNVHWKAECDQLNLAHETKKTNVSAHFVKYRGHKVMLCYMNGKNGKWLPILESLKASAWHQLYLALLPFTHARSKSIKRWQS